MDAYGSRFDADLAAFADGVIGGGLSAPDRAARAAGREAGGRALQDLAERAT